MPACPYLVMNLKPNKRAKETDNNTPHPTKHQQQYWSVKRTQLAFVQRNSKRKGDVHRVFPLFILFLYFFQAVFNVLCAKWQTWKMNKYDSMDNEIFTMITLTKNAKQTNWNREESVWYCVRVRICVCVCGFLYYWHSNVWTVKRRRKKSKSKRKMTDYFLLK